MHSLQIFNSAILILQDPSFRNVEPVGGAPYRQAIYVPGQQNLTLKMVRKCVDRLFYLCTDRLRFFKLRQ